MTNVEYEIKLKMNVENNEKKDKNAKLLKELEYIGKGIIKLEGFIDLAKELSKFIDKEGKVYFELIETYMKKFALDLKKRKNKADKQLKLQSSQQKNGS